VICLVFSMLFILLRIARMFAIRFPSFLFAVFAVRRKLFPASAA
jgi:hypothetical protein